MRKFFASLLALSTAAAIAQDTGKGAPIEEINFRITNTAAQRNEFADQAVYWKSRAETLELALKQKLNCAPAPAPAAQ